nr:reverse transcriptase domain-containing protein [Tanacetum cinerariifolium]
MDKVRRDKRKEVHASLNLEEGSRERKTREGSHYSSARTLSARPERLKVHDHLRYNDWHMLDRLGLQRQSVFDRLSETYSPSTTKSRPGRTSSRDSSRGRSRPHRRDAFNGYHPKSKECFCGVGELYDNYHSSYRTKINHGYRYHDRDCSRHMKREGIVNPYYPAYQKATPVMEGTGSQRAARVWFDELPLGNIDSYKDLRAAFLSYFMHQKKYIKDLVQNYKIKQKDGETIKDFMERFKVETERMKRPPECMRIYGFMHGVNNPELTKCLNDHVPKTIEEMMITTTAFIRGEAVTASKKKEHYEDILPIIMEKVRHDRRKDIHTRLDFGEGPRERIREDSYCSNIRDRATEPGNSTLIEAARVWFDELPPESLDGYKDLRAAFLTYFMQQKKYVKDPVEIHNIKQRMEKPLRILWNALKQKLDATNPKGTPQIKDPTSEVTQGREGGLTDLPPSPGRQKKSWLPKQIEELVRAGKLSHLIKEIKLGRDQSKTGKKETVAKDKPSAIYMVQSWQRTVKQKVTQSFERVEEIAFPQLTARNGTEGPLVIEAEMGGHMIHCIYIDSGDATHSTKAWMNFMVVKSMSPYNGIIGRPGLKAIQAVPSTVHGMLKFLVEGGIATIRSTILIPTECASVTTSSVIPREERTCPANFTVALHPDFPDQEVVIGGSLSDKGRTELCSVLKKNSDIFAWQPSDMTGVPRSVAEHRLNIREGYSPVRWRMCVDFTDLNKACPQDCYPLSEIDWKVESICGYPFKCFLDAYKGYHQIQLAEADEEKTAFHTRQGVYCYTKMPFGLKNDGATYQRLMDKAFKSQVGRNIEVYVDDLVVKSYTEAGMMRDIEETFRTLRKVNMKLNPKKCSFGLAEGVFLGYVITSEGIKPCPVKTAAVLQLPSPRTIKETLKKCIKKSDFRWIAEAEQAFQQLKQHLSELPLLVAPKPQEELIMYLSATYGAVSAVLMTERGTTQTPIYFISRALQEGVEFTYALRFQFTASNNEAEYEALVAGLRIAARMGVKNVQVNVDSKLVANQVLETYVAKEDNMIKYLEIVKGLVSGLTTFLISQVPRSKKKNADALSKITSTSFAHLSKQMTQFVDYLNGCVLIGDKKEARKLRLKARQYELMEGVLYRRSFLTPWLRCVGPLQADYVMREIHEGSCSMHAGPRSVVAKAVRLGYYWPTMHKDACDMIRKCNGCQIHRPVTRHPQQSLTPITAPWPFYKWGIDIAGPFPEGPRKVKFLIVAMDYFTKWIEAKTVATITRGQVKKFVWDNIVCRFGIPGEIISGNGKQFADNPFKDWCDKLNITQRFASVKHPQSNRLVERANRSLGEGIKARLGEMNKNWVEELPYVLWAHRTMIKSSHGDTPFSLIYGTEAVIPTEIGMLTYRTAVVDVVNNDEELRLNLDLLEERRERAAVREARAKSKMMKYYNARVRDVAFKPCDFVFRNNDASHAIAGGKLGPKWEGPYEVTKALGNEAYKLQSTNGTVLPRTWNVANLKRCYL